MSTAIVPRPSPSPQETPQPTTLDILRAALALIEDEAHWCADWYAMDAAGKRTGSASARAVRWCVKGAVGRVAAGMVDDGYGTLMDAVDEASEALYGCSAAPAQDTFGHAAAVAILRAAVAAEGEGL